MVKILFWKFIALVKIISVYLHISSGDSLIIDCHGKNFICTDSSHFLFCHKNENNTYEPVDGMPIACLPGLYCDNTFPYDCGEDQLIFSTPETTTSTAPLSTSDPATTIPNPENATNPLIMIESNTNSSLLVFKNTDDTESIKIESSTQPYLLREEFETLPNQQNYTINVDDHTMSYKSLFPETDIDLVNVPSTESINLNTHAEISSSYLPSASFIIDELNQTTTEEIIELEPAINTSSTNLITYLNEVYNLTEKPDLEYPMDNLQNTTNATLLLTNFTSAKEPILEINVQNYSVSDFEVETIFMITNWSQSTQENVLPTTTNISQMSLLAEEIFTTYLPTQRNTSIPSDETIFDSTTLSTSITPPNDTEIYEILLGATLLKIICTESGRFPHPKKCNKYIWCLKSENELIYFERSCPSVTNFDPNTRRCTFDASVCKNYSEEFQCKEIGYYSDPYEKSKYYLCTMVGDNLKRYDYLCPQNSTYDSIKGICARTRNRREEPKINGSKLIEYQDANQFLLNLPFTNKGMRLINELSVEAKILKSICKSSGRFQHPDSCNKYVWCLEEDNLLLYLEYYCPNNTVFDVNTRRCTFDKLICQN